MIHDLMCSNELWIRVRSMILRRIFKDFSKTFTKTKTRATVLIFSDLPTPCVHPELYGAREAINHFLIRLFNMKKLHSPPESRGNVLKRNMKKLSLYIHNINYIYYIYIHNINRNIKRLVYCQYG